MCQYLDGNSVWSPLSCCFLTQLSGALLLEGDTPRNGRTKNNQKINHKGRKLSGSGLLALAAAWHQTWMAGPIWRYHGLEQLEGSSWHELLHFSPAKAVSPCSNTVHELSASYPSHHNQCTQPAALLCPCHLLTESVHKGTTTKHRSAPAWSKLKSLQMCRAAVRRAGKAKLILEARSLKGSCFSTQR